MYCAVGMCLLLKPPFHVLSAAVRVLERDKSLSDYGFDAEKHVLQLK